MESRKKKRRWWLIVCLSPKNGKPRAVLLLRPFFSLLCLFWTLSKNIRNRPEGLRRVTRRRHTHRERKGKKKKIPPKTPAPEWRPPPFFRPTIARGAIDRFSSATQRAGEKDPGADRTGAYVGASLLYTHSISLAMHSLCQLIFSLSLYFFFFLSNWCSSHTDLFKSTWLAPLCKLGNLTLFFCLSDCKGPK